jgi:hypothetical protein
MIFFFSERSFWQHGPILSRTLTSGVGTLHETGHYDW